MDESIPASPPARLSLFGTLIRLWSLRRLPGPLPTVRDWQLVSIAAASFALWLVLERSAIGPNAVFFPYNLPDAGWFVLIALWMAWAISRRTHPPVPFRDG